MRRAIQCLVCVCVLAPSAEGQQIASVDLTQPSAAPKSGPTQRLPKGCRELSAGGIADGVVLPPKGIPRDITVEIANLTSNTFAIEAVVQAEIRLRNSGKYPIQIPWSTDPNEINTGRDPSHARWERGSFSFALGKTELLKSMARPLYGSSLAKGSQIDILPGEWITAKATFQLEPEYAFPGHFIGRGEQQLHVEWEQEADTRDIKDCAVTSGFFRYRDYYHQHDPPVTIKVN